MNLIHANGWEKSKSSNTLRSFNYYYMAFGDTFKPLSVGFCWVFFTRKKDWGNVYTSASQKRAKTLHRISGDCRSCHRIFGMCES